MATSFVKRNPTRTFDPTSLSCGEAVYPPPNGKQMCPLYTMEKAREADG
jgi:hypothetical protein